MQAMELSDNSQSDPIRSTTESGIGFDAEKAFNVWLVKLHPLGSERPPLLLASTVEAT